jgi:hypothetical protein
MTRLALYPINFIELKIIGVGRNSSFLPLFLCSERKTILLVLLNVFVYNREGFIPSNILLMQEEIRASCQEDFYD